MMKELLPLRIFLKTQILLRHSKRRKGINEVDILKKFCTVISEICQKKIPHLQKYGNILIQYGNQKM